MNYLVEFGRRSNAIEHEKEILYNSPYDISINNKSVTTVIHPWRRYFARIFDLNLYSILWLAFSHLILRWNFDSNVIYNIVDSYITIAFMLLIEPCLLSTCGTTPGKWAFGLVIRTIDGNKLTFDQSFKRTFGVFKKGFGYNIPIYDLVREFKCYKACIDGEPMVWEEGLLYEIKDTKLYRIFIFLGLSVITIALTTFVYIQAQLPIHRGNITAEQYYENCNDIISYHHINLGKYLNKEGKWVDKQLSSNGFNSISIGNQNYPKYELTTSNGFVTGIKIEVETTKSEGIESYYYQKYIAVMSFLAVQKEMNAIRLTRSNINQKIKKDFQNYTFIESGIRVTNKVEYSGYDLCDEYLFPTKGKKQYLHMVFTLEKIS